MPARALPGHVGTLPAGWQNARPAAPWQARPLGSAGGETEDCPTSLGRLPGRPHPAGPATPGRWPRRPGPARPLPASPAQPRQGRGGWILRVGRLQDPNRLRPHQRRPAIQHRQQLASELDRKPAGQPEQLATRGDLTAAKLRQQPPQPARRRRIQLTQTWPGQAMGIHRRGSRACRARRLRSPGCGVAAARRARWDGLAGGLVLVTGRHRARLLHGAEWAAGAAYLDSPVWKAYPAANSAAPSSSHNRPPTMPRPRRGPPRPSPCCRWPQGGWGCGGPGR